MSQDKSSLGVTLPEHQQKHTLLTMGYGFLSLLWLSFEDSTILIVSLLGWGLAFMLMSLGVMRWFGGRELTLRQWILAVILFGGLVGLGAIGGTVELMLFKNAWHSHANPDFSGNIVIGLINRALAWTFAGSLIGIAASLYGWLHYSSKLS